MPFQSTLPRGSDRSGLEDRIAAQLISIHAPSRERLRANFNWLESFEISIHAPSRERPKLPQVNYQRAVISIHAPSRERPYWLIWNEWFRDEFQSTLPRGSDICRLVKLLLLSISIHAPSRERPATKEIKSLKRYFNPRSLAGATGASANASSNSAFQSTLPRGSDAKNQQRIANALISIHAPSRERRR